MTQLKVAIIGGGPGGLTAAKAALEHGLEPHVFEARDQIGGVWHPDEGLVWSGLTTNLSRYTCAFSDHVWDDDTPDFPTAAQMHGYLTSYAQKFSLNPYIQTGTRVLSARRLSDGGYEVTSGQNGQEDTQHFDRLVMANGIFNKPYKPVLQGNFRDGGMSHSADYKGVEPFVRSSSRKRVAVIGNSFTGIEIASDLAANGATVLLIFRRPIWILPRYAPVPDVGDLPLDLVFYHRDTKDTSKTTEEINRGVAQYFEDTFGNPGAAHQNLTVPHDGQPNFIAISDHFLTHVNDGKIIPVKTRVDGLKDSQVSVKDGSGIACDHVIFATGYTADLSLLDRTTKAMLAYDPKDRFLPFLADRSTMHPDLPDLGFVGMYRGPYFGTMELQARLIMARFAGQIPHSRNREGLYAELDKRIRHPRSQFPHPDYVTFCDELATQLGMTIDPDHEGPITPAHYRPGDQAATQNLKALQRRLVPGGPS